MSLNSRARRRARAIEKLPRRRSRLLHTRVRLGDGRATTLHVASYERAVFRPRLVTFAPPRQLGAWCHEEGVRHAIVGGFFTRPAYEPLGELWLGGRRKPSVPFEPPWSAVRACAELDGDAVRIARRDALPARPRGDRLQAGPLLVCDGRPALADGEDPEGFSAGSSQFDSDITRGRYPRAALGLSPSRLFTVVCDGRTPHDAGMTLGELAEAMAGLGATSALNLDGGGSSSLVYNGRLRNRPREEHGVDLLGGRPIVSAIVLD